METKVYELITKYDSIIISRHNRPDNDALGSQFGLKHIIEDNFKNKKVYVVGDMTRPSFMGVMDEIDESIYEHSLLIYVDTSVKELSPNIPYEKAKEILCIDHHNNICNFDNATAYYDRNAAAACQIVASLAFKWNLIISKEAALCLYTGIVSDSNRFNYSLSKDLFDISGRLIDLGIDYQTLYNTLYEDDLEYIKMKAYFINQIQMKDKVCFIKSDIDVFKRFKVDFFTISRLMVNCMSNLKNIEIWANFTVNPENNKIGCEFRSKRIEIVDLAIKYGGGGHRLACGATVDSFEIVDKIIDELIERANGRI